MYRSSITYLLFFLLSLQGKPQEKNTPFSNNITHLKHVNKTNLTPSPVTPLISSLNYQSEVNGDARNLNYNLLVGTNSGNLNVNANGQLTYSIPIITPPGTKGIEPALSILYNSQNPNGILGVGFFLNGLSSISRASADLTRDGYIKKASSNLNIFEIDGQRLVVNSGTPGAHQSSYSTEIENYEKIISYANIANGPGYFKVFKKDGTIYEYGFTSNSRVIYGANNGVTRWLLNKVTDVFGNYMTYTYDYGSQGEYWISRIDYTGNNAVNLSTYNYVEFIYEDRDDPQCSYIESNYIQTYKLLKEIRTYNNNSLVKTYAFSYSYDKASYLNEFNVINSDGSKYNSTIFNWSNNYIANQPQNLLLNFNENYIYYNGDFNGDGKDELLVTANGLGKLMIPDANGQFTYSSISVTLPPQFTKFITGEFNADGKTDLLMEEEFYSSTGFTWKYTLYTFNRNRFYRSTTFTFTTTNQRNFVVGDFNGDGYEDLFSKRTNTIWEIRSFNDIQNEANSWVTFTNVLDLTDADILTGDFNNDKKNDLLFIFNSSSRIYELQESSVNNLVPLTNVLSYPVKVNTNTQIGDFNGDGKSDIFTAQTTGIMSNTIGIFNDINFSQYNAPTTYPYQNKPFSSNYSSYTVLDLNGDGRSDIYELRHPGAYGWTPYIHLNQWLNSNGNFANSFVGDWGIDQFPNLVDINILAGDFNGNSSTDILLMSVVSSQGSYYAEGVVSDLSDYLSTSFLSKRIHQITNGLNRKTQISYSPLTNSSVYTKGNNAIYPLVDVQSPIYVVNTLTENMGVSGNNVTSFKYGEAKNHLKGKGFLGFMKFTQTNLNHNIIQNQRFSIYPTAFIPMLIESNTQDYNSNFIKKTTFSTTYSLVNNIKWAISDFQSIETDYLKNISTTTQINNFDNYGNPQYIYKNINNNITEEQNSTYENINTPSLYLTGRLLSQTVTATRSNQPSFTSIITNTYSPTSNLISSQNIHPNDDKGYSITYNYNTVGLATEKTISPNNSTYGNPRAITYGYDNLFRFLQTETNALNQSNSYTYDSKNGKPTSSTNSLGLTTTYQYNGAGLLTKTIFPDLNEENNSISWVNNNTPSNAIYSASKVKTGHPAELSYFDNSHNLLQSKTNGFTEYILKDYFYNNKGELTQTTMPYYSGSTPASILFEYDYLGRTTKITKPGNDITQIQYNGLTTESNINNHIYKKTVDETGNIIISEDFGGAINYEYNSMNKISKTTLPNSNTLEYTYDINGYLKEKNEPNVGLIKYDYNPFGELISTTDNKGTTTTFQYDAVGKLELKTYPDQEIEYNYQNNGLLSTIASTNGSMKQFGYDGYGRINDINETVNGTNYNVSFEYNSLGYINTLQYPNGYKIKYDYTNSGYLEYITDFYSNNLIFLNQSYNALNELTNAQFGNGITIENNYDQRGFPQKFLTSSLSPIQDFEYTFDIYGNLSMRKDLVHSQSENLEYDELNRLTKSTINNSIINNISYEINGNIQKKDDIGEDYIYGNNNQPNAVTEIKNVIAPIPSFDANFTYNTLGFTSTIEEGDKSYSISYGPELSRNLTRFLLNGNLEIEKTYIGNLYEKTTTSNGDREICYIGGFYNAVAVNITENNNNQLYYLHKDHLGSITAITDESQNIIETNAFDAWGNRIDPSNWEQKQNQHLFIGRGYTSHEHLVDFNLINMNGRIYDPVIAQFTSPDPFIQAPDFTQSYNRYAYCMNNPLNSTDPSGYRKCLIEMPIFIEPYTEYGWTFANGGGGHITLWGLNENGTIGNKFIANEINTLYESSIELFYGGSFSNQWLTFTGYSINKDDYYFNVAERDLFNSVAHDPITILNKLIEYYMNYGDLSYYASLANKSNSPHGGYQEMSLVDRIRIWDENNFGGCADQDPGYGGFSIPENGSVEVGYSISGGPGGSASLSFAWDKHGGRALQFNLSQSGGFSGYGPYFKLNDIKPSFDDYNVNNNEGPSTGWNVDWGYSNYGMGKAVDPFDKSRYLLIQSQGLNSWGLGGEYYSTITFPIFSNR